MTYLRGDKAQFDAWEKLGNPGWNWASLFKGYKESEKLFLPQPWQAAAGATYEPSAHGYSGNVHVGFPPTLDEGYLYNIAEKTWEALGYRKIPDPNAGSTAGFSVWPLTADPEKNERSDAATSFYWAVKDARANLKLYNGTVTRILWKQSCEGGATAVGVEYLDATGNIAQLHAKKEVILSAGALRTPLILERSGVGNPNLLRPMGIDVVLDLPTVGENLIDQPNVAILYGSSYNATEITPYATFATADKLFGRERATELAESTKSRLADWAKGIAEASRGAVAAGAVEKQLNIQHELIFERKVTIAEILTGAFPNNLASVSWALLPFSRGSVHLTSAENKDIDNPLINPRLLSNDFDMETQIASSKLSRELWETSPAKELASGGPKTPTREQVPLNATDEQWRAFIRGAYTSNSHSLGTAAMMSKELGGVVDPELRVYGTTNVRVVDASVLPTQFSGHLTATLYAVAERASDMITNAK